MSKKVDWMSRADCMVSTVARSNSAPEGASLCSPFQDYELALRLKAALTAVDANILIHVLKRMLNGTLSSALK
jgi:hypothetical protein